MFISKKSYFLLIILFLNLLFLVSCDDKKEDTEPSYPKRMNYFSMEVDGEAWQPSFIDNDTCKQTFYASQSGTTTNDGIIPFYNIDAHKDPNSLSGVAAENMLRMQIMDVTRIGKYEIKNSYRVHFDSFVSFQIRKDKNGNDKKAIYTIDSTRNIFDFYVDEIVDTKGSFIRGIIGRFEGVLYNIQNPLDSVIITNGKYKFTRLNWIDDCHCEK